MSSGALCLPTPTPAPCRTAPAYSVPSFPALQVVLRDGCTSFPSVLASFRPRARSFRCTHHLEADLRKNPASRPALSLYSKFARAGPCRRAEVCPRPPPLPPSPPSVPLHFPPCPLLPPRSQLLSSSACLLRGPLLPLAARGENGRQPRGSGGPGQGEGDLARPLPRPGWPAAAGPVHEQPRGEPEQPAPHGAGATDPPRVSARDAFSSERPLRQVQERRQRGASSRGHGPLSADARKSRQGCAGPEGSPECYVLPLARPHALPWCGPNSCRRYR